jgi:hypothetical protein
MDLKNVATNLVGGLANVIVQTKPSQKSPFENVPSPTYSLVVTILFIFLIIMITLVLPIATYKLTDSIIQAILCFLFGYFYLMVAFIFYGYLGYKFIKVK